MEKTNKSGKKCAVAIIAILFAVFACFAIFAYIFNHNHSYVDTIVAPTCVDKSYTLHKCDCGEEYKDSYTDATGVHTFMNIHITTMLHE